MESLELYRSPCKDTTVTINDSCLLRFVVCAFYVCLFLFFGRYLLCLVGCMIMFTLLFPHSYIRKFLLFLGMYGMPPMMDRYGLRLPMAPSGMVCMKFRLILDDKLSHSLFIFYHGC